MDIKTQTGASETGDNQTIYKEDMNWIKRNPVLALALGMSFIIIVFCSSIYLCYRLHQRKITNKVLAENEQMSTKKGSETRRRLMAKTISMIPYDAGIPGDDEEIQAKIKDGCINNEI